MPKGSYKVLPWSEKMKVLNLRKGKLSNAEAYGKMESSLFEIVKKAKETSAGFVFLVPQTSKFITTVPGKCSVNLEKALSLYKIFWERDHIQFWFSSAFITIFLL